MKRNVIQLNEQEIKGLVYHAVKKILKESYNTISKSGSMQHNGVQNNDLEIEKTIRENVPFEKWARMMAKNDADLTGASFEESYNSMEQTYYDDCIEEFIKAMHSNYFNDVKFDSVSSIIKEFLEFSPYYYNWDE